MASSGDVQSYALHDPRSEQLDIDYRRERILNYIHNIEFTPDSEIETVTPSSCPSLSDMDSTQSSGLTSSKNLRQSDGAAYKEALTFRNVRLSPQDIDSYEEPVILNDTDVPDDVKQSLELALLFKKASENEYTSYLLTPFLLADWLVKEIDLRFHLSRVWKTEQLQNFGGASRAIGMPKPDVTIGFNWPRLSSQGYEPRPPRYALPIHGDFDTALPFFAVEMKLIDQNEARFQNLHTAALMLRNLRLFYERCHDNAHDFDGKIRVLTATITLVQVQVYGHWIKRIQGTSNFWYDYCLLHSWSLLDGKDLYTARKGLQAFCQWMAEDNRAWIITGIPTLVNITT